MINVIITGVKYLGSCTAKWFQVGRSVELLEMKLDSEIVDRQEDDERIQTSLQEAVRTGSEGRAEIHERIDRLQEHFDDRFDRLGRELNALHRHLIPSPKD